MMEIAQYLPASLVDYEGKISAVLYTQGCNFACGYCHNGSLIGMKGENPKSEKNILEILKDSIDFLDAVVITGGEPTIHHELPDFLRKIRKETPYSIKLDTNGSNPEIVQYLIENKLVDFVAMDIKAPFLVYRYRQMVGNMLDSVILDQIKKTIDLLKHSGIDHEFRTTLIRPLLGLDELDQIADLLGECDCYALQAYEPAHARLAVFRSYEPYPEEEMQAFAKHLEATHQGLHVKVR